MKRLATMFLVLALVSSASAVPTDLELVLLCDVSGSVDSTDFELIRDGYEAAFRDPGIISAIEAGDQGSIAVTLVYWSVSQAVAVDWTLISDAASANAFAQAIADAPRSFAAGATYMARAMNYAIPLFNNGYEGNRLVIDVTGDGADSIDGFDQPIAPLVQAARDSASANGIGINALFVEDPPHFGSPGSTIDAILYGQDNVITGPGAFVMLVENFLGFQSGVLEKIGREIQPKIPAPSAILLGSIGAGLVGWLRRRRTL